MTGRVDYDPNQPSIPGTEHLRPEPPEFRVVPVRPHLRKVPIVRPHGVEDLETTSRARTSDPSTSHAAASRRSRKGTMAKSQVWVLRVFRGSVRATQDGLIDHDLYRIAAESGVKLSEQGIRTARVELVKKDLLERTGFTRLTPYGNRAESYRLTAHGRAFPLP